MKPARPAVAKLLVLAAAVVAAAVLAQIAGVDLRRWSPETIKAYMLSFGQLAPVVYLLVYGQPVIPLPASLMTLAGGLAFGPVWGAAAALAGGTIRACSQFLLVRLLGRQAAAQLFKDRLVKLQARIGERAITTVILIRIVPNLPFDVQNCALALSGIRFWPYALGSFLGLIPGALVYVYFGYSLTDLRQRWKLLLALGLVLGFAGWQHWLSRRVKVKAS